EPSCNACSRTGITCARVPSRSRLCYSGRREGNCARRAAPPRSHDVRSRGRRGNQRRDRSASAGRRRRSVSPRRLSIRKRRRDMTPRVAHVFDPRSSTGITSPADRHGITGKPAHAGGEAVRKGVPPEILRQVKLIELRTRGLVNSVFTGEYRSVFKGQGMEFSEVREYQAGDEVRIIDWNVTARMGRPFVKRYVEERELTVMLAVDLSGSERFGTVHRFKSELASELAAVLAMSAVRNNDRVGVVLFTDRIEYV